VISASDGAGHDGATPVLAAQLHRYGFPVTCLDLTDVFPWRLGRLLRGTYRGLLTRLPWLYDWLLAIACRFTGAAPVTRALLSPIRPRMHRSLPAGTAAVVSTYPIASQLLGPLRRSGRLPVPVITYLTDFAVHPIWVSPGVDVHCAAHDISSAQAIAHGASDVRVAGRLASARCRPASAQAKRRARQHYGLPAEGRLALLLAGSWGVGHVAVPVADIAATGTAVPVVVCGRNAALCRRLRQRFGRHQGGHGGAYVFDLIDDMPTLIRAADVLVENAGRLTALEAMACGLPVLTYRPIAGHGKANAVAMAEAGVVSLVHCRDEPGEALVELTDGLRGRKQRAAGLALFESDPAAVIADIVKAVQPRPGPAPDRSPD
jgi:UDP-N-acetylglucosamine:LPS N-acetylglucosamine transferase